METLKSFFGKTFFISAVVHTTAIIPIQAQVADSLPNVNRVYVEKIKTVLLYKDGFEMSAPIMNLSSGEKLKLSFDEMGSDMKHYRYTFRHCEADWTTSSELRIQ